MGIKKLNNRYLSRRKFLKINAAVAGSIILYHNQAVAKKPITSLGKQVLNPTLIGKLKEDDGAIPWENGQWYIGEQISDGLHYKLAKGGLAQAQYLNADILLDGNDLCVFEITLKEGLVGSAFSLRFGVLNQCAARIRFPLSLVDLNQWRIEREGAWLKPNCRGERVDLNLVDRITFKILRKSNQPVRWCLTPIIVTNQPLPKLTRLILPQGKLLDAMGQSQLHSWPTKSRSTKEVTERLRLQFKHSPRQKWPQHFSRWGGWQERRFLASGFFRTEFANNRWWLVDPDGYAFWSAGCNCVRLNTDTYVSGLLPALEFIPERQGRFAPAYRKNGEYINFTTVNLIRAFGSQQWQQKWTQITLAQLRQIGFNTIGNWSEWEIARQFAFPYVRPLHFEPQRTQLIYRDFPDVFDPAFLQDAADYAQQLNSTLQDPALIGYFMMNEPHWAFSQELPAVGMLFNTPVSHTRRVLSQFLRQRYGDPASLAQAWEIPITFEQIAAGAWQWSFNPKAIVDLTAFSEIMVERFFLSLHQACQQIDPQHLNLGIRYQGVPPDWAIKGMTSFDVFSMNSYTEKIPFATVSEIQDKLKMPTLIGEFHFGSLDVGLPASGIGHVKNQVERGRAYRVYLEDAAANPNCVGVHWFQYYDQSALGRYDGENYNIGFLDICNRPYLPLSQAARNSHEAFYAIASGQRDPYTQAPKYLPKLFL